MVCATLLAYASTALVSELGLIGSGGIGSSRRIAALGAMMAGFSLLGLPGALASAACRTRSGTGRGIGAATLAINAVFGFALIVIGALSA